MPIEDIFFGGWGGGGGGYSDKPGIRPFICEHGLMPLWLEYPSLRIIFIKCIKL